MITCTKCKVEQSPENYHKRKDKDNGLDSWCKTCKSIYRHNYFLINLDKEKARSREKAWQAQGIDLDHNTYMAECLKRNNRCDICTKEVKPLHVDHCHTTGKIRGYLCGGCNKGLGLFKDSIESLQQAIGYLNGSKNLCNS